MTVSPAGAALDVDVDCDGATCRVTVSGELDVATRDVLTEQLTPLAEGGATMLVDAEGLTFVDSSGLQSLLETKEAAVAHGGRFRLVTVSRSLALLLEITGTHELLTAG